MVGSDRQNIEAPSIVTINRSTVDDQWSQPRRARQACGRCRRQKLRCDDERPCNPCIRSQRTCEEPPQRPSKIRRISQREPGSESTHIQRLSIDGTTSPLRQEDPVVSGPSTPSWQGRPSTLRLVEHVFKTHQGHQAEQTNTFDAIPDGSPRQPLIFDPSQHTKNVSAVLGIDLPAKDVVLLLYDSFLETMHWYHCMFYGPTFVARLRSVLDHGVVHDGEGSLLLLLLIVMITGARYLPPEKARSLPQAVNFKQLQDDMIQTVEAKVIIAFDEGSMDSLAFLFLLASHYLLTGCPSKGFLFLGLAVRLGQSMGLYNESLCVKTDPVTREMRRRLFWSLYVSDGFVAQIFGRPAMIHEVDIQVQLPGDLDDSLIRCPGFSSTELRDDGSTQPVTIHSYMRLRASLYRIAAPIGRDMYARKNRARSDLVKQVKDVHQRLLAWERMIPQELRLASFTKSFPPHNTDKICRTFQIQALALQISYENIQLLLHRPLLSYVGKTCRSDRLEQDNTDNLMQHGAQQPDYDFDSGRTSKNQCWQSAMRISLLVEHSEVWKNASKTPLGSHIGIHAFTAGVMLGIFALSSPGSGPAQEAKQGIARIVRMPCIEGYHPPPIWPQCTKILENLLRLILAEELDSLLSGTAAAGAAQKEASKSPDENRRLQFGQTAPLQERYAWQSNTVLDTDIPTVPASENGLGTTLLSSIEQPQSWSQSLNNTTLGPDGGFEDAFLSLQSVIFGGFTDSSSAPSDLATALSGSSLDPMHGSGYESAITARGSETFSNRSDTSDPLLARSMSQSMDHPESGGQMWMWRL